jgi:hypothetical protein
MAAVRKTPEARHTTNPPNAIKKMTPTATTLRIDAMDGFITPHFPESEL